MDSLPSWRRIIWDLIVFAAVILSVTSVLAEVILDLDETQLTYLFYIDAAALSIFIIDLILLWRGFHGPIPQFIKTNFLDILAVIPFFRIIRVARFARLLKLERVRRVTKLQRVSEVRDKIKEADSPVFGPKGKIMLFPGIRGKTKL